MKKLVIFAVLMLATSAYAAQNNTGCQGNCPGGDTVSNTTNQGGAGGTAYGGAGGVGFGGTGVGIGGNGGAGGQGGQGGAGGNAIGTGGAGGSVSGSGNSRNELSQGQGQSQTANGGNASQGQSQAANNKQSQSNSSKNDNRSNAANTNSNANNGNNSAQTTRVEGDTNVSVYRAAVSTAYAPNIAPTALCALGVSAGGQGMSFGFSIGGSYIDTNCQQLEQVRTAAAVLGDKESAAEMMCGISEAYREARATTGKPCGSRANLGKTQAVAAAQQPKPDQYTDPIIRGRLGLPPLK